MRGINRRDIMKGFAGAAVGPRLLAGTSAPALEEERLPHGWSVVGPGIWKATVGTPEAHTPVRSRRIDPAFERMHVLPDVSLAPLPAPQGSKSVRGVTLRLPLEPGELIYGFGLQMQSFQQRSRKRTMRVNADPRVDSGDSHAPVPFYVSTRGYGVLVDTLRQATFYCGDAHPRPARPERSESLEVNTPQMMRARDRGRLAEMMIEVPRASGVDVYLFAGPELRQAVQRYNLFAGGGVLPPEWGLGFWYRPEMHLRDSEVLALADELRSMKVPCDVLGLEPGWQTHAYSCTFVWDRHRFPEPATFVKRAGEKGFRINLWEHAYTHPASPLFPKLQAHSGNFAVWDGLVPDFAGAPARRIFGDYHGATLIDAGISGFKLDECDNSDFTGGWSFPDNTSFPSGVDGEQMHAEFGLRYQDAILEQFERRGRKTYGLVRSSGALAAPYPFVLYSDLYDHRDFIRSLVNAGFSGLLWCPEVRDAASEEDLVRRLQSVVFSPLAMVNAWYIRNPPWKQIEREANNAGKFTPGWERLADRCREIISWRMQLVPYLRAAFAEYERSGLPPFRALIMDEPANGALSEIDDQYMVGDRLMVAPLFAGERERRVVLPSGSWVDFWTGKPVDETRFTIGATYEKIPAFVRAGSLFPWAEPGMHAEDPRCRRMEVRVYGAGDVAWAAPASAGGLRLTWDAAAKRGAATQSTTEDTPYEVTGWKQIG